MKSHFFLVAFISVSLMIAGPACSQDPSWLWARSAEGNGGAGNEAGLSVTSDATGNVFVTGYFTGNILKLGSFTLTRTGTGNVFLAKYDAAGNVLWATTATGTGYDVPYAVATDAAGNVIVAGSFSSPEITFGSVSLINAGIEDAFIVKYDAAGNAVWAQRAGEANWDNAHALALDGAGNIYLAGAFRSDSITFGPISLPNTFPGIYDAFLAKYDPEGNVIWARAAGGPGNNLPMTVSSGPSGNVCVAGTFGGSHMTFDVGLSVTNNGLDDLFLARYDGSGNVLWAKSVGGTNYDQGNSVVMDGTGNAYLAGMFSSETITFGTITLLNIAGGYYTADICLAKYDSAGNVLWAAGAGGPQSDLAMSVTTDPAGNVYATGHFYSDTCTFGSTRLVNTDYDADLFVVKYNPTGSVLWAVRAGGTDDDKGISLARDANGYLYLTGNFNSPFITFGADTLENSGNTDLFLAKLDDNITGTSETPGSQGLALYPNPATGHITVSVPGDASGGHITVYNLQGQLLLQQTITGNTNRFDVTVLPPGMYIARVSGRYGVSVRKFMKL